MRPARRIAWPIVALASFTAVALLRSAGWLEPLEFQASDTRSRLFQREVSSDIVIVGIDATSLAELERWPWPRRQHARLLDTLRAAEPRSVFLDISFSSVSPTPEDDRLLAEALARWRDNPVVLPAFLQRSSGADSELVLTRPLPAFERHSALGSVNLQPSGDGLVREVRAGWQIDGELLPAAFITGRGEVSAGTTFPIDFSISPSSFAYVSYSDVLAGRIDPAELRNKSLFVGAVAVELGDNVAVPVYQSLPGVAVLALAAATVDEGGVTIPPQWLLMTLLAVWAVICALAFEVRSWRRNLLATAAALAFVAAANACAFAVHHVALESVPAVLVTAIAFLIVTLRSLDEQTLRALMHALGVRRRDALLHSIVDSSSDCIVLIDGEGYIRSANPAAARLFECESGLLQGRAFANFVPALAACGPERVADTLETLDGRLTEAQGTSAAGREFPVDLAISRVRLKDERLYTAIVRDISERKAQQRELEYRATHDPLTALPNRNALAAHLEAALATPQPGESVVLLMLDLCRFKEVNDTLGHNAGDAVLREVARRFREVAGANAFVARIGGDEFTAVLAGERSAGAAESLATRLQRSLREPIAAGEIAIDVGLSVGIARFPDDASDAETLLRRADVAMYDAKRRGSAFEHYDAAHDEHSVRKLTMASELRSAIANGQLALHYQPQVDLRSRTVHSAEALLRWEHPVLGRVNPDEFIGIAENSDLIQPLTEWTLREALDQAARWRRQGLEMRIAVNLSARLLQDVSFPARLKALLAQSDVLPAALELEITESAMMLDPHRALRIIRELHALGVLIAVDDFGTGFSSLGYLRDLPVQALKLDKSFVMNMRARPDDRVIVESTVRMAHALGLLMVAEGVETEWDARFLAAAGYDYAQGYRYSRAVPAAELAAWVATFNAGGGRNDTAGVAAA